MYTSSCRGFRAFKTLVCCVQVANLEIHIAHNEQTICAWLCVCVCVCACVCVCMCICVDMCTQEDQ